MAGARTLDGRKSLKVEKRQAKKLAKELCYSSGIIELIEKATNSYEITTALKKGRLRA